MKIDGTFLFDKAVAHELLHSIGVEHHGEGDKVNQQMELLRPADRRNTAGKPAFLDNGEIVSVVSEAPPHTDIAGALVEGFEKKARELQALLDSGAIPEFVRLRGGSAAELEQFYRDWIKSLQETDVSLWGNIGMPRGQHSGDEQCVMRYYFARSYPSKDDNKTYYAVPDNSEPSGLQLCDNTAGTGVNAGTHQPQARYFDAAPRRGGCRHWICVNDAVPPDSDAIPELDPRSDP